MALSEVPSLVETVKLFWVQLRYKILCSVAGIMGQSSLFRRRRTWVQVQPLSMTIFAVVKCKYKDEKRKRSSMELR